MATERRAGPLELRASGRTLTGPAIRYGDVSPTHRERFEAGAFALDGRTRWLNLRHDPEKALAWTGAGLALHDGADALMVRAELPQIPAADRALADVAAGRLTGFSIEFRALAERRESGIRVVERAELDGVGLVGAPSYEQSTVELRGRMGRSFRTRWRPERRVACRCSGAACKYAKFKRDALRKMQQDAFGAADDAAEEVVAAFGSYDMPLASVSSGTLRGRMRGADLEIEIDLPEGSAGAAALAAHDAAGVIARPYIDMRAANSVLEGETRVYASAPLRGVLVSATDAREGWDAVEVIPTPALETASASARRRIWL